MTTSSKPKTNGTDLGTQGLPIIPPVDKMEFWNMETLLRWIQQRDENLLEGDHLENFKKEYIGGRVFLESDVDFYQSCGLPRGIGRSLKILAGEVKEGKPPNQTAGKKRKADEIDAPEPSISTKINDEPEVLLEIAAKARKQRKRIKKVITDINDSSDQHSNSIEPANPLAGAVDQHSNSIEPADPLAGAVDQLSDPTFERMLPFPFAGSEAPVRFKPVKGNWQYVGRTKFKELVQEVKEVQESECFHTVWLYGTQGYGKSHLLAALVCYLTARDERVVYIPDCRALLEDSVEYLQEAMLFTWADDIAIQKFIMTLNTLEKMKNFFKNKKNVIFVIDQMNALKSDGSREQTKREDLSNWIQRLTFRHTKVYSSSANNMDYHREAQKQNQSRFLLVYGGLTETEMDQWWERHSDIDRGGYEKHDIEDITGRIPLLLDKCVVGKKIDLTVKDLGKIYDKAMRFTQQVKERNPPSRWKWYYDYVTACLRHTTVPGGRDTHLDLIDHRYFYKLDDDTGRYTCSLIRDAVIDQLLTWNEDFADTDFIDNRSVAGFRIEHAVLSSIRSNGLAISAEIGKAMHVRLLLRLTDINTDITGTAVLYRPKKSNFKAIDGMIVLIEPGENDAKKKLLLFPLQIILTPADHKDSRTQFFEEYGWWITSHSDFDVEVQFLWITPEYRDNQEYPASEHPKWPKYLERYIPFWDVNQRIWEKYKNAQEGLPETKTDQQKLQKNKGSSIKAVPERAASTRVAAKKAAAKAAKGGTS